MKKSTRKVIDYLKRYIGHEVVRTKPAGIDRSYCKTPILLVGFTSDGRIIYRHNTGFEREVFGDKEMILPDYFTDRNWITANKARKSKGNELNKWIGKKIRRVRPTPEIGDKSYMNGEAPTLISASKHHMVIELNSIGLKGNQRLLGFGYVNPEDWELAE